MRHPDNKKCSPAVCNRAVKLPFFAPMNSTPDQPPRHDPYAVLRLPDFRLFISFRFLVTIAIQIQAVVVGWQLYAITKDPLSLGLIGLAEAVPAISVALYAGHLADLIERKKIILSAYLMLFLTAGLLFAFSHYQAQLLPKTGTWPVYAAIFLTGLARGFVNPANFAFLGQLVPKSLYHNSSTWNSTIWQIAAITGPAAGGLIYAFSGPETSYQVVAVLFGLGLLLISFIRRKPLPPPALVKEPMSERLTSGLKFVFRNPVILSAISLDLFAVLFGGAVALLPVFAADILHTGPEGLGVLRAAPAVGAAIMAFALAHRPPMEKAGRNLLWAVSGFGLSMIGFALSTNFYISLLMLVAGGALDSVSVVIRSTIMQLMTPDHMRGRVSAVNNMFIGSSNEIGAFESGVAARLMGTVTSVVFGGTMTLLVVLVTWLKAPALQKIDLHEMGKE